MTGFTLGEVADALKGGPTDLRIGLYYVTAVNLSTYTVTIQETPSSGTSIADVPVLESYWPSVNETVFVIMRNGSYIVLGKVDDGVSQGWTNIGSFTGGWTNLGSPESNTAYKRKLNVVRLRGAVKTGSLSSAAFTLPVGYRPAGQRYFAVVANNAFGAVRIDANGDVVPTAGDTTWVALDNISFVVN